MTPKLPPSEDLRVFRAQIHALYQTFPANLLGLVTLLVVWCVVVSLWLPLPTALTWSGLLLSQVAMGMRGVNRFRYRYALRPMPLAEVQRWATRSIWATLVIGSLWGAASIAFLPAQGSAHAEYQYLLLLTLAGMVAVGAFSAGAYLPMFWAFLIPSSVPITLYMLSRGTALDVMFGVSAMFFIITSGRLAVLFNRALLESFRIRFANEDLVRELATQHQNVLDASAAKTKFLASASHDLRQPLHAMELFVEALQQSQLPTNARPITVKLRSSLGAMRELLDALLDISKLDAGVIVPHPGPVELASVVPHITDAFQESAMAKGLQLRTRIPSSAVTHTDTALLKSVLTNLISNAVRYTAQGGILVTCRPCGPNWVLDVIDTGIGIDASQQQDVFKEFVQLHNPQRDRTQGLGLGLAIVARLSQLLGHQIELRSVPGRGSRFRLTLPRVALTGTAMADRLSPGTTQLDLPSATPDLELDPNPNPNLNLNLNPEIKPALDANALVVVIDDETAVREAMQLMLPTWGLRALCAPDAQTAIEALALEADLPLVIISDYRLADHHNGIDAIAQIRSEYNAGDELPALLVTGDTASHDLVKVQASGTPVMHKPVNMAQLRAHLQTLCAQRAQARAAASASPPVPRPFTDSGGFADSGHPPPIGTKVPGAL
jgi:two-component system, sensor histidine kinase